MGLFTSKLKCPRGYDKKKFGSICQIFHRLDENGDPQDKYNRSLNYKNMKLVCDVYYKYELIEKGEEIKDLIIEEDIQLKEMIGETDYKVYDYEEKCYKKNGERVLTKKQKEEVIKYKLKNEKRMNKLRYSINQERSKLSKYIDLIESFNQKERAQKLVEQIRGDKQYKKNVEFEKFFKFFKHKDISKIIETLNG